MTRSVQKDLFDDGTWCPGRSCAPGSASRAARSTKSRRCHLLKLDDKFVQPIKALIEEEPSFGYRTVA